MMQRCQVQVAESGNVSVRADDWLPLVTDFAAGVGMTILEDSEYDNALKSPTASFQDESLLDGSAVPQAERMASMYNSIVPTTKVSGTPRASKYTSSKRASLGEIPTFSHDSVSWPTAASVDSEDKSYPPLTTRAGKC